MCSGQNWTNEVPMIVHVITMKASANKIKILIILIWNGPCIFYLEWLFVVHLFRKTYHSQVQEKIRSRKFILSMLNSLNKNFKSFDFICRCLNGLLLKISYSDDCPDPRQNTPFGAEFTEPVNAPFSPNTRIAFRCSNCYSGAGGYMECTDQRQWVATGSCSGKVF